MVVMSLSEWSSQLSSQSSDSSLKVIQRESHSLGAFTLNDWLHKKKDDLKPENRIRCFITKAEEAIDEHNFEDAMALYSQAIELAPTDTYLYTERSYCHQMLQKFELSLTDAQKAIELSDKSVDKQQKVPKTTQRINDLAKYRNKLMYYRKARALVSLKRFQEAIDALVLSKSLAIECQFIDNEIKDIKLQVICDLGYDRQDVKEMCNQLDSIEELIKLLNQRKQLDDSPDYMPSNPFGYTGLYVNGLAKDLEEKKLEELLTTCGELLRCKVYSNSEQSKAIISFSEDSYSVRKAIRVIRSNKDLIRDQSLDNLVFRYRHSCLESNCDLRSDPQLKFKSTEIGGECFKWRTTGCDNKDCKLLHIPLCHHLDQQSVETKSVSERKRKSIVFDSNSLTKNVNKREETKQRQRISFNINGDDDSSKSPKGLTSPSKRLRTRDTSLLNMKVTEESLNEELDSIASKRKPISSDRKGFVVFLKSDSPATDSPKVKTERKRIVFHITCDDKDSKKDTKDNSLIDCKPLNACPAQHNNRNVTSYDDLFD